MFTPAKERRFGVAVRSISTFLIITFLSTTILPPGYAQSIGLSLPIPGTMVSQSPAFVPVLLKGMTVHPDNPLQFDFIIDSGHEKLSGDELKKESERLVKYFLASMTVPQNDLWVNLSPYEKDRIIPDELGKTEMGRDLLAQDYVLKQLTATMMYPEEELGKKFWDRVYKLAKDQYGIKDIPTDTFNKVWILPESANVYEHENTVYITDSHLKVMLDVDYFALQNSQSPGHQDTKSSMTSGDSVTGDVVTSETGELTKQVIRDVILPEIEKEVNTGKNFATLRQIYHSLILAKWYKQTVKNSIMSQVYIDQNKTAGIELTEAGMKEKIYDRYMQAYKKGVFNYIKEDYDELSQTVIPRQYFSGGFKDSAMLVGKIDNAIKVANAKVGSEYTLRMEAKPEGVSKSEVQAVQAMLANETVDIQETSSALDAKASNPSDAAMISTKIKTIGAVSLAIMGLYVAIHIPKHVLQLSQKLDLQSQISNLQSVDSSKRISALQEIGSSVQYQPSMFDSLIANLREQETFEAYKIMNSQQAAALDEKRKEVGVALEAIARVINEDTRFLEALKRLARNNDYVFRHEVILTLGTNPNIPEIMVDNDFFYKIMTEINPSRWNRETSGYDAVMKVLIKRGDIRLINDGNFFSGNKLPQNKTLFDLIYYLDQIPTRDGDDGFFSDDDFFSFLDNPDPLVKEVLDNFNRSEVVEAIAEMDATWADEKIIKSLDFILLGRTQISMLASYNTLKPLTYQLKLAGLAERSDRVKALIDEGYFPLQDYIYFLGSPSRKLKIPDIYRDRKKLNKDVKNYSIPHPISKDYSRDNSMLTEDVSVVSADEVQLSAPDIDLADHAMLGGPWTLDGARQLCTKMLKTNQWASARQMEQIIKILKANGDASDVENYITAGLWLLQIHRYTDALDMFKQAEKSQPSNVYALNNIGYSYLKLKQFKNAENYFYKAIQVNPKFYIAIKNLAQTYHVQGRYAEAEKQYLKAIEINPRYSLAHNSLGYLYAEQEKFSDAEKHFLIVIRLNPEFDIAYSNLGLVYLAQKEFPKAKEYMVKAINLNPSNEVTRKNMDLIDAALTGDTSHLPKFSDITRYFTMTSLESVSDHAMLGGPWTLDAIRDVLDNIKNEKSKIVKRAINRISAFPIITSDIYRLIKVFFLDNVELKTDAANSLGKMLAGEGQSVGVMMRASFMMSSEGARLMAERERRNAVLNDVRKALWREKYLKTTSDYPVYDKALDAALESIFGYQDGVPLPQDLFDEEYERQKAAFEQGSDHAMLSATQEDAIAYQKEIRQRFESFHQQAHEAFFNVTDPEKSAFAPGSRVLQESLFHHIPVTGHADIRQVYQQTQEILHDVLGGQAGVVDMDLNEIHVTIANDDIDAPEKFFLTLDQLLKEVSADAKNVAPFSITLIGPRLMKNGVVVMEFTTDAPEFLHLRRKAEQRINERKQKKQLSATNRAFAPDIIHSTVSDLRDTRATYRQMQEIFNRLDKLRQETTPVTITVDKMVATHFRESDRRFIESREIPLADQAMLFERARIKQQLIDRAQQYIDLISQGDDFLPNVNAFLVLGNPDIMSMIHFATTWKNLQATSGKNIPIVLAGGRGRGTVPLIENTIKWYADSITEDEINYLRHPDRYESDVIRFILQKEKIPLEYIQKENTPSKTTLENFINSRDAVKQAVAGISNPVIAITTWPPLLMRVKATAEKVWENEIAEFGWNVKKLQTYQLDLTSLSDTQLVQLLGYMAGYPVAYQQVYPKLSVTSELRGTQRENNLNVKTVPVSDAQWQLLSDVQTLFEQFLDVSNVTYDISRNNLSIQPANDTAVGDHAMLGSNEKIMRAGLVGVPVGAAVWVYSSSLTNGIMCGVFAGVLFSFLMNMMTIFNLGPKEVVTKDAIDFLVKGVFGKKGPLGEDYSELENRMIEILIANNAAQEAIEVLKLKIGDENYSYANPAFIQMTSVITTMKKLGATENEVVDALISVLNHEKKEVREFAARRLGVSHDQRAIEPLKKLLSDPEQEVQTQAQDAINQLTAKNKTDYAMLSSVTKVVSTGLFGAMVQSQAIAQSVLGTADEAGFGEIALYTGLGLFALWRLATWMIPLIVGIASSGDVEKFVFLLQRGANINARSILFGWTPLTVSAQNGHYRIVKILLQQGAKVNVQDNRGYSPLINAAHNGHTSVVELLLESDWGVEVDLPNRVTGATALYYASQTGRRDISKLLLQNGAKVNFKAFDGGTPLIIAAQMGHRDVVELLIDEGADLNARNNEGITALMVAAYNNHQTVVKLLLGKGADPSIKDNTGRTAMDDAREHGWDILDFKKDQAMLTDPNVGGIDMNEIAIDRQTSTQEGEETQTIQFNMQGMEPLLNMDIQGFSPVIIDMIPINSVLPLLGLAPLEKGIKYGQEEAQEELQLSMN
jgi:ankyrin repeat protein/Tfp pilus assembly protein PilF